MRRSTLKMILAMSQDRVIGDGEKLLWHNSNDLKFFKNTTKGFPIIMGRKTFCSLNQKPLPNRENIVLSRTHNFENVKTFKTHEDILKYIDECNTDCYIIGGKQLYEYYEPYCSECYVSEFNMIIGEGDYVRMDIDFLKGFEKTLIAEYEEFKIYKYQSFL